MSDDATLTTPSAEWVAAIASLTEAIGTDRFPVALRQVLSLCCHFDSMIIFQHESTMPPVALYQDLDELRAVISVEFYASGPYLLDPFYRVRQSDCEPGAYRLMDVAPGAFYRSEYYRAFFRKISVSDEIGLVVPNGDNDWFAVSLARSGRTSRFEASDTARLNAVFDVVAAALRRQWGRQDTPAREFLQDDWDESIRAFGSGVLSAREQEIVQLILLGHSTPSAAAYLGIAEGTVKVHRYHAYSKLGISSQAELFAMASRHLIAS